MFEKKTTLNHPRNKKAKMEWCGSLLCTPGILTGVYEGPLSSTFGLPFGLLCY